MDTENPVSEVPGGPSGDLLVNPDPVDLVKDLVRILRGLRLDLIDLAMTCHNVSTLVENRLADRIK